MRLNKNLIDRAIRKASSQTICRYKVSAIGINHRGEVVYAASNRPRFNRKGGGIHAEMTVMKKSPPSLKSIILCRVGREGKLLKIHPCKTCQKKADELGVKIYTI